MRRLTGFAAQGVTSAGTLGRTRELAAANGQLQTSAGDDNLKVPKLYAQQFSETGAVAFLDTTNYAYPVIALSFTPIPIARQRLLHSPPDDNWDQIKGLERHRIIDTALRFQNNYCQLLAFIGDR
jgi:hypothetical protein